MAIYSGFFYASWSGLESAARADSYYLLIVYRIRLSNLYF